MILGAGVSASFRTVVSAWSGHQGGGEDVAVFENSPDCG